MPQLYWIIPLEPGHAGNELPGGPPGHVGGGPIYHPGHPSHGLPSHGHVGGGPIYHPGHPDHGLPSMAGRLIPVMARSAASRIRQSSAGQLVGA